jgi:hypothetical protein
MSEEKPQATRVFLLTEEELERFDHMLTALGQAYWALVRHRSIAVPDVRGQAKTTPEEERFYELHLELNDEVDHSQP